MSGREGVALFVYCESTEAESHQWALQLSFRVLGSNHTLVVCCPNGKPSLAQRWCPAADPSGHAASGSFGDASAEPNDCAVSPSHMSSGWDPCKCSGVPFSEESLLCDAVYASLAYHEHAIFVYPSSLLHS